MGHTVAYPVGDANLNVIKLYGMLPAEAGDTAPDAATSATVRTCS